MTKRKAFKLIIIIAISGLLISGGIAIYLFNMPHRDVQNSDVDYSLTASQIVSEYLQDVDAANQKYLSSDGNSKILEISGVVNNISEDYNGRKVVLLKSSEDKAGVSSTFTTETNSHLNGISAGQTITIKGVIRSGATYDEDLEMFEHVILEKSDIIKK